MCEELNIPVHGSVFRRTKEEIRKIVKIHEQLLGQLPTPNSFSKKTEEVEKIIQICLENEIPITGTIYHKKPDELLDTIEWIKQNYGKEYLLPQIIICDKEHVEQVFAYLKGRRCLEIIKNSQGIIRLTLEEIVEREIYIHQCRESFVIDGVFNPILGLSTELWKKRKNIEQEQENEEKRSFSNRK